MEGQKTAAFEVVDELGEIDALCIPVGNAGNITAYWRGFREAGLRPRMYGFQAEGAAPLVRGAPVAQPETIASAIRIGNPARWEDAMAAMTDSGGRVSAVSDEQILACYRMLAHGAGGAERIVCVLTGHGLKDPDAALDHAGGVVPCEPELAALEQAVLR
jgi:threonine synthase